MAIDILYVCFGNTCRSPAAEYYARKFLRDHDLEEAIRASSAGFSPSFAIAQEYTTRILSVEEGMDMSAFRCRALSRRLVSRADYVVPMEQAQKVRILRQYADVAGIADKVVTLKELAREGPDPDGDVVDPYMSSFANYQRILHEIKAHVAWGLARVAEAHGLAVNKTGRLA